MNVNSNRAYRNGFGHIVILSALSSGFQARPIDSSGRLGSGAPVDRQGKVTSYYSPRYSLDAELQLVLPIQPGQRYLRRDGKEVTAVAHSTGQVGVTLPGDRVGVWVYSACGRVRRNGEDHPADLIASVPYTTVPNDVPHIHAELMRLYAIDAKASDTPWTGWQYFSKSRQSWVQCDENPRWFESRQYRKKPAQPTTRRIGDVTVPAPLRTVPVASTRVFIPALSLDCGSVSMVWTGTIADQQRLRDGLLFATADQAAAVARALKAQLV